MFNFYKPFRQTPFPEQLSGHVACSISSNIDIIDGGRRSDSRASVSFANSVLFEVSVLFVTVKFSIFFAFPKHVDAKFSSVTFRNLSSPMI